MLFNNSIFILLILAYSALIRAEHNPFFLPAGTEPDGQIAAFSQNDTGDCFFLASLIAIAEDSAGLALIESSIHKASGSGSWEVIFPNFVHYPIIINEQEINSYQLTNNAGDGYSFPVLGDPDVKILEIAADKFWKSTIKEEGLWDDIPMNAVYLFSNAEQLLILNTNKMKSAHIKDINKYQHLAATTVKQISVTTIEQIIAKLKEILAVDHDGISMVLIDYVNYHAVAIKHINFLDNTYSTVDTTLNIAVEQNLTHLLLGVINGQFALNYFEIK